jgi:hypothetical protein
MRSKVVYILTLVAVPGIALATDSLGGDSTSVTDSVVAREHMGPLGMDDLTGLCLFLAAILLLVLTLFLWRRSIVARRVNG